MKTTIFRQTAKCFALLFLIVFGILPNRGFAESIDLTGGPGALVLSDAPVLGDALVESADAGPLDLPGSPVQFYWFSQTPVYSGPFAPPDGWGSNPWSFLATGNTLYNFTGDPYLELYQLELSSGGNLGVIASQDSPVPEPRSNQLFVAGLMAIILSAACCRLTCKRLRDLVD